MKTAYSLNPSAEELSIREEEHFFSLLQSEPDVLPMEGVVPFAELLRSRYPLALASSSSHVVISQVLSRLQMQALFDIVVSGDDVKYGKPAPDIFLLAAEKLGFEPHHCLVIEDSAHGVASAKAAGMSCIGFKGTPHNKHDLSLADRIIGSFHMTQTSQIEDIIDLKIQK
jgi:HAD superfamily hydrolase (TIGR01509 family)